MEQHDIVNDLGNLGLLLLIAYVLARLVRKITLPPIPVYIFVGLCFSVSTRWFPLHMQGADVELVSLLGLIMLLFSLGLEFDQEAFTGSAGKMLFSGAIFILFNLATGLLFAFWLDWGGRESMLVAGIVATSSSAIVTKLMISLKRLSDPEAPLILGITVVEDIAIAMYLVVVSILLDNQQSLWIVLFKIIFGPLFLVSMLWFARKQARLISRLTRVKDQELLTILFFGLAVFFAWVGNLVGVTDAVGAFLIGVVLGAGQRREIIAKTSVPLRDVFAAFFFISFGLNLNPEAFPEVFPASLGAVLLTVISCLIAVALLLPLNGLHFDSWFNISFILHNRGEFAIILAALASRAGLDPRIQAFSGLFVLIMSVIGPLLAANSGKITCGFNGVFNSYKSFFSGIRRQK